MSRKHDAVFDDVLSGLDRPVAGSGEDRGGARFLKRSTGLADRLSGDLEEKTLIWVDPARCRMWERHNRDYGLLTEDNCRDLIDGIKAQGRQEFPAIVRRLDGEAHEYEVICGARRHFAVTWLRGNNYPQFKYLVDVRDLTDEEAFRLADIENRDREDISDYERAIDYFDAIERYYGGKQKAMAERLEVSQPWLSRYLQLAKLPSPIVDAFYTIRDIKERHARDLKPLLGDAETAERVLAEAARIRRQQANARKGRGSFLDGPAVITALKKAAKPDPIRPDPQPGDRKYHKYAGFAGITVRSRGRQWQLEFDKTMSRDALEHALAHFIEDNF